MVKIDSSPYPLLRRPFSIHSANETSVEIFFQKTGIGTDILSQKKEGDSLDIIGPLGNGFDLNRDLSKQKTALIGGGRGIAPLFFLAQNLRLQDAETTVLYGGKTREDLPLIEKFESEGFRLLYSTDDGSFGFEGMVTELFLEKLNTMKIDLIFACGPEAMLERIAHISREQKIPSQLSLEAIMGCGFGACWGCVHKIRRDSEEEWQKICEEGPVFKAEEIIWTNKEDD
jgi:dihydroorotate dehydrogenase electron transfer subunit